MDYWRDKIVLVTGSSRGFGRVLAETFAKRGAKVALTGRQAGPLEAVAAELRASGYAVWAQAADLTRDDDVSRLVADVVAEFGRLDCLVNNAGRSARRPVLETSPEEFRELVELNLLSLVRMTRAAAPHLLAAQGHLVNIGSLAAKSAARYLGAYPASKFAVAAYSQQLRLELGPLGLHTLLVCPGPIQRRDESVLSSDELHSVPESARGAGGGVRQRALDPERLSQDILRSCERRAAELIRPRKARLLFALAACSARLGDWLVGRFTRG